LLNLETYCNKCKRNTTMVNTSFQRLANYKAIISGNCSICNSEVFKGKIISKPSVNKKFIKMKKELARKNNNTKKGMNILV
jgi:hypothetical protein